MAILRTFNFEDGTTQGIEARTGSVLVASTVAVTTAQKFEGTSALRHTADASGDTEAQATSATRLDVTPGTQLRMSLHAREGSGVRDHYFGINFFDSAGAYLKTVGTFYAAGTLSQTSWKQFTPVDDPVPGTAVKAAYVATQDNVVAGDYYDVDLITVETVDDTTPRPPLHESFNKVDGLPLGPDLTWTQEFANRSSNLFETRDGQLTHMTDAASTIARAEHTAPDNQSAELTLHALPASTASGVVRALGVQVRLDNSEPVTGSTHTYYSCQVKQDGTYSVWKRVANTLTRIVDNAAIPGGLGSFPVKISLVAEGSKISFSYRGDVLYSGTDTSIASGKIGLWGVDGGGVVRADNFGGGALTKSITIVGSITPRAKLVNGLSRVFAGSTRPAGTLTALRAVLREFAGSIAPAGGFFRVFSRLYTGALKPGGAFQKTPRKRPRGTVKPAGALTRGTFSRIFASSITPAGTVATTFLGRVLGVAGTVIMRIAAAGEARLRFRRR